MIRKGTTGLRPAFVSLVAAVFALLPGGVLPADPPRPAESRWRISLSLGERFHYLGFPERRPYEDELSAYGYLDQFPPLAQIAAGAVYRVTPWLEGGLRLSYHFTGNQGHGDLMWLHAPQLAVVGRYVHEVSDLRIGVELEAGAMYVALTQGGAAIEQVLAQLTPALFWNFDNSGRVQFALVLGYTFQLNQFDAWQGHELTLGGLSFAFRMEFVL